MTSYPITDPELIAALADRGRHDAWYEFERIYAPALLSTLRKRGFAQADAEDCSQRIFAKLIQAVSQFESDGQPAAFRRWLYRVARNETASFLREQTRYPKTLTSSGLLCQQTRATTGNLPGAKPEDCQLEPDHEMEAEYRKHVFFEATAIVQAEVSTKQWQAFWMTMVQALPTHRVAKTLGMSVGAVYVAKGRVLKKLQAVARRWEESQ
jgi:RNA polymerase sigma-70 factor (ECF subfamily)